MPKAPDHRTSSPQWDGELALCINSPVMSLSSAAANQGSFVAPCDLTIVAIVYNLIAAPDVAAAEVEVGSRADDDEFVAAWSIPTTHATGLAELPTDDAAVISLNIDKGDVVEFKTDGGATSTGSIAVTLVCMPRSSQ